MYFHEEESLKMRVSRSARTVWKASLTRFKSLDNMRRITPLVHPSTQTKLSARLAMTRKAKDYLLIKRSDTLPPQPKLHLSDFNASVSTMDSFLTCTSSTDSLQQAHSSKPKAIDWLSKCLNKATVLPLEYFKQEQQGRLDGLQQDEAVTECGQSSIREDDGGPRSQKTTQEAHSVASLLTTPTSEECRNMLCCKVLSIANLATCYEDSFELDIRINDKSQTLVRGTFCKQDKSTASCIGPGQPYTFPVGDVFELSFVVATQRHRPFVRHLTQMLKRQLHPDTPPVVVGVTRMSTVDNPRLLETTKAIRSFRLANPNNVKGWDIEIVVELQCERLDRHHRFWQTPFLPAMPTQQASRAGYFKPMDSAAAQRHCESGSFLTIYARNHGFPTWERCWATLQDGRFSLRKYTYKHHGPMYTIDVAHLLHVSKPSLDEQDALCLGHSNGIVLWFDPNVTQSSWSTCGEQHERLEGKMFLFADNARDALAWEQVLLQHCQTNEPKEAYPIDLRLLW